MGSRLTTLWNLILMALVILGMGGLAYQTLRPGGWMSQVLGVAIDKGQRHPLVIGLVVAASIWVAWRALNGNLVSGKSGSRVMDMLFYALALVGAYVLFTWLKP